MGFVVRKVGGPRALRLEGENACRATTTNPFVPLGAEDEQFDYAGPLLKMKCVPIYHSKARKRQGERGGQLTSRQDLSSRPLVFEDRGDQVRLRR